MLCPWPKSAKNWPGRRFMKGHNHAVKLTDRVYWVGAVDWNIRDFHGYSTEKGTTYNSYLVKDEKVALFDTVKREFKDDLLYEIKQRPKDKPFSLLIADEAQVEEFARNIPIAAYKLLDKQAEAIPIGSGDLIFLPHMMVGERAPYWDEHIRGAFLGVTVYHTRAHMFRAILEGVGYAMRYSIDAARDTGIEINRATLVDGGASSPLWRQIIADTTEIEFHYIPETLGAPMGDAILAGLGTGEIKDHRVIEDWIGDKISTKPKAENMEKYRKHYRLYVEAVEKLIPYFSGF